MAPASTSQSPLLKEIRKHQREPSWWQKHISGPVGRFSLVEFIFVRKIKPSPPRSIYVNQPLPDEFKDKKGRVLRSRKFYSNQNVTSKYTILTFVPRNLLEQFRRVANCFFLFINILQFFPQFSTISPGLVMLPLIVVLGITALKDGYEDIKRHQADKRVNNSIVHTLAGGEYQNRNPMKSKSKTFVPKVPIPYFKSKKARRREEEAAAAAVQGTFDREAREQQRTLQRRLSGEDPVNPPSLQRARTHVSVWEDDPEAGDGPKELGWHRSLWEDLKVGDIVKIYDNEQFPADIAICATSEEEDVAYIETKNLDGETNLKSRHAVTGLAHLFSAHACAQARLRVDLDAPEVNMYKLNGAIINEDEMGHDGLPAIHPISLETVLLRGCVLKNTAWVIGIVMYTGHDTKIIQNSGATPSKRSKVERQMDPQVLLNLALLGLLAMVCAIVNYYNELRWINQGTYWTLFADTRGDGASINGILTFLNAFITFQNIVPISLYISIEFVRTAQAAFIYFDREMKYIKNGVVTRTQARSWTLSDDLGQIQYVFSDKTGTLTQNAMIFRQCSVGGKIYSGDGEMPETLAKENPSDSDSSSNGIKVALPKEVLAPFHDKTLNEDLQLHDTEQSRILHGFFAVLGLCHTVLAAEQQPGVIEYKAQSPDEAALVQSAADVGFIFRGRDKNTLRLQTPFSEVPDEYELLHVLEFNSARKRMSVILRKMDDEGRLFLLCKGADNVIFERLAKDSSQAELRAKTDKDLQFFASEGLRTLCLAYRVLDITEYEQWARDYHQASVAIDQRDEKVEEVSSRIEQGLTLLGATAIEDKLQDGVPECISDLKRAGIKVWVATGDKLETAVAIGYTTHLLTNETNLIIVREGRHSVKDQILDALEGFFGEHELAREISRVSTSNQPALARVNTGTRSLAGADNGTRPGGFSLVIEGSALAHAFGDRETNELLLALSTRCNTVICCRVSPLQKAQIVRLIKDNLGVMCLAIGDGANDVSMIQAADVGVGISGEEGLQAVNSSDYAIAQFRYLRRLLFVHGQWSYFRNSSMILNFFYKNMVGIGVLWWFQPFCGFSTTFVFSYTYLLFWNVFWTLVPVLAIGLFDRNIDAYSLMTIPELYRYGREGRYFKLRRFAYYMLEGAYQSAVVYYFLHYTYLTTSTRPDGWDVYIYEMSTTMAIAAVMVANFFTGLNIFAWVGWTYFGILFGPALVWVYTAVFSSIPPSSFVTGVYGNQVFLFRSYAFWFGWPFVIVIALMPRYFIRFARQNLFPDDIDQMRLVRMYQPEADPATHPLLGGKLAEKAEGGPEADTAAAAGDGIQMQQINPSKVEEANGKPLPQSEQEGRPSMHHPRSSMSSGRFGRHGSARGSQVDMSTGVTREPSRGFDFTAEEGGVAMQRMQSRLSQASSHRRNRLLPPRSSPLRQSGGNPFGISRIRERAGSVFSPRKRRDTTATKNSSNIAEDETTAQGTTSSGRKGSSRKTAAADVFDDENQVQEPSSGSQRRKKGSQSKAGEGEEEDLGRGFGVGQNIAPPELPRV